MPIINQRDFLKGVLDAMPEALVVYDTEDKIQFFNAPAETMFGLAREEVLGQCVFNLLRIEDDGAFTDSDSVLNFIHSSSAGVSKFASRQLRRATKARGEKIIHVVSVSSEVTCGDALWKVVFFRDVTSERNTNLQLQEAALTDPLSMLYNRRGFQEKIEENLGQKLSLAIIDADKFKELNDTFGHQAGDQGIQFIARLLRESFPDAICLARLGGDEFGVVMLTKTPEQTELAFARLLERFDQCKIENVGVGLTVSVGVAISQVEDVNARELLLTADRALYSAKRAGRNVIMTTMING